MTATSLGQRSDEELRAMLAARPDLLDPPPATFAVLERRASSWPSLALALDLADQFTHHVVHALCLLPAGPAGPAAVAAALGAPDLAAEVGDALSRLETLALVSRAGGRYVLHPALRHGLRRPAGLGASLEADLNRQGRAQAERVAVALGLADRKRASLGKKPAAVALALEAATDVERVRASLAEAPEGAAALFEELLDTSAVLAVGSSYYLLCQPSHPVGWLAERGLLVAAGGNLEVPREVALAFRGGRPFPDLAAEPPPVSASSVDAGSVASEGAQAAQQAADAVDRVLAEWATRPATVLKAGGVGSRDLKRAAKATGLDERTVPLVAEVAAAAGLLALDADSAAYLPTPAWDEWRLAPPSSRYLALMSGWLTSLRWPALAGRKDTKGHVIPPLSPNDASEIVPHQRRRVLEALASVPDGHAGVRDDLAARACWSAPEAFAKGPCRPATLAGWMLDEAAFLGVTGAGALTPAGRCLLAADQAGAGAALEQVVGRPTAEVTLQADLTAMVAGDPEPALAAELTLAADVESRGAATVWRFSEASVRRALDAGRRADDLLGLLERHTVKGVPQPLAYLVADVGRRHGEARVGGAASYVRSDDPALLARFLASRRGAKLGARLLAPTVAVSTAAPAEVLASLRAEGLVPALEDASGAVVAAGPPPRRARGGGQRRSLPALADLDAAVSRLRRAPSGPDAALSAPGGPSRLTPVGGGYDRGFHLDEHDELLGLGDGFADDPESIAALLELAALGSEGVELGWSSRPDGYQEAVVRVVSFTRQVLIGLSVAGRRTQPVRIPLADIEWAELDTGRALAVRR